MSVVAPNVWTENWASGLKDDQHPVMDWVPVDGWKQKEANEVEQKMTNQHLHSLMFICSCQSQPAVMVMILKLSLEFKVQFARLEEFEYTESEPCSDTLS